MPPLKGLSPTAEGQQDQCPAQSWAPRSLPADRAEEISVWSLLLWHYQLGVGLMHPKHPAKPPSMTPPHAHGCPPDPAAQLRRQQQHGAISWFPTEKGRYFFSWAAKRLYKRVFFTRRPLPSSSPPCVTLHPSLPHP